MNKVKGDEFVSCTIHSSFSLYSFVIHDLLYWNPHMYMYSILLLLLYVYVCIHAYIDISTRIRYPFFIHVFHLFSMFLDLLLSLSMMIHSIMCQWMDVWVDGWLIK